MHGSPRRVGVLLYLVVVLQPGHCRLAQHLLVIEQRPALQPGIARYAVSAVGQPVPNGEVDSFPAVEAMTEPRMVGPGKSNDILPRILHHSHHLDTFLHQQPRAEDSCLVEDCSHGHVVHIRLRAAVLPGLPHGIVIHMLTQHILKPLCITSRHAIPCLGCPQVVVVDRVKVVVLDVPGKGGKQHANVEHGVADTGNGGVKVSQQGLPLVRQNLEVPLGAAQGV
mmetsp:Transcript_25034/g.54439  ORF Transcript_25034/g.54439 Transcript_25034/m.54439 type:complete len:224 (-) Transcript_25034:823-1494(-)